MDANEPIRLSTWKETLLALIPFLSIPTLYLLGSFTFHYINTQKPVILLGVSLALLSGFILAMLIGWVKGFPRWVFPYWGFFIFVTLYLRDFSGTIAGYWVDGNWWAWAPVAAVALIGTIWARSLEPVHSLLKLIWKDWALLSFAFYGALPLMFLFAYDEVRNEGIILSIIMFILAIGASLYMRTENIWHRFASLVGGFSIGWLTLTIHQGIYWHGRQEFWMNEPGSWTHTLDWTSQMGAVLLLILVAPVLVVFIHWVTKSRQLLERT